MTLRALLSTLLAVMLALTSQSMAVAKGQNVATGQMVICAGAGTMVIYVDADGQPTSSPHVCPEATLAATSVGADWVLSVPTAIYQTAEIPVAPVVPNLRTPGYTPPKRGPPA